MGNIREKDSLNPTGYFEDRDIQKLLDKIFERADPEADGFNPPPKGDIERACEEYLEDFKEYIEERSTNSRVWGWKEVKTCFVIDNFFTYLKNPYFIIVEREMKDIIESSIKYTEKKDYKSLDEKEAREVISRYYKTIYDFIEKNNVDYYKLRFEDIIESPRREVKNLANFMDEDVDKKEIEEVYKFVKSPNKMQRKKLLMSLREKKNKIIDLISNKTENE